MIIGIVGSRRRTSANDFELVKKAFLFHYQSGDTICSGLCPTGADEFAVRLSKEFKTKTLWFPAEWEKYGRGAGFKRNTDIALNSQILIACVSHDRTGGTEDTVKKFVKMHGTDYLILV